MLAWYLHTADTARHHVSPFSRYVLDQPAPTEVEPQAFDGYEPALRWYRTEATRRTLGLRRELLFLQSLI